MVVDGATLERIIFPHNDHEIKILCAHVVVGYSCYDKQKHGRLPTLECIKCKVFKFSLVFFKESGACHQSSAFWLTTMMICEEDCRLVSCVVELQQSARIATQSVAIDSSFPWCSSKRVVRATSHLNVGLQPRQSVRIATWLMGGVWSQGWHLFKQC
jgi:hypothetical protein